MRTIFRCGIESGAYVKRRRSLSLLVAAIASGPTFFATPGYSASNQTWDPGHTPATGSDGSGSWDASTANWSDGTNDGAWVPGNIAIFGASASGAGGAVNLTAAQSVGGITFNAQAAGSAYTLSGSTLTLAADAIITDNNTSGTTVIGDNVTSAAHNAFTLAGAGNLTLNSNISTSLTATMNGTGTVTFGGATDNAGFGLIANSGTVILGKTSGPSVHAIGGGGLTIAGALVQLSNAAGQLGGDQIYNSCNVNLTSGTLDLNGQSETVGAIIVSSTAANGAIINSLASTTSTLTASSINATTPHSFTAGGAGNLIFGNLGAGDNAAYTLTKVGAGTLTLTGAVDNPYCGVTVNAGTVVLGKTSASNVHAIGNLLTINGSGAVAQLSSATGQLGGDQIFNGASVAVTSGTFDLNGQSETIGNLSGAAAGIITNTKASTVSTLTTIVAGNNTYSGVIQNGAGAVSFVKNGSAILTLIGTNTYTGGTAVNGGTLQVNVDAQFGAVPASPAVNITLNGGEVFNHNSVLSFSANRTIYLGSSGGYFECGWGNPMTINGLVTGPGGLGITWDGGALVFNSANTYQGDTTIGTTGNAYYNNTSAAATLRLGVANAIPSGSSAGNVVFGVSPANAAAKATLDLYGFSAQVNGVTGGSNAVIDNTQAGAVTLTVGNNDAAGNFAGTIKNTAGTLSIVKTGAGTQVLSGVNAYSGNTTVASGTLQIGVANALPSAGSIVMTGGTLDANGFANTLGPLSISSGVSTLQFGAQGDSGSILKFASASVAAGTLQVTNWDGSLSGGGSDQFFVAAAPSAAVLSSITFVSPDGASGSYSATSVPVSGGFEIVPTQVPEPASATLLLLAGAGLLSRRRRRA